MQIVQYRTRIIEELRSANGKMKYKISSHEAKWTHIKNVIFSAAKKSQSEIQSQLEKSLVQ